MGTVHIPRVRTAIRTLSRYRYALLTGWTALQMQRSIVYRYSLYTRYQWWSSCSDLNNKVRSRSQARRRGSGTYLPRINVAPVPRPRVFRTMGRRYKKFKQAVFFLHVRPTVLYMTKIMQLLYSAPAPGRPTCARAHLMPHVTILNSHFLGGAKLRPQC